MKQNKERFSRLSQGPNLSSETKSGCLVCSTYSRKLGNLKKESHTTLYTKLSARKLDNLPLSEMQTAYPVSAHLVRLHVHSRPPAQTNGSSWNVTGIPKVDDNNTLVCCAILCPKARSEKGSALQEKTGRSVVDSNRWEVLGPKGSRRRKCGYNPKGDRHLKLKDMTGPN